MAKRCDITGKGVLTGNNVSHSKRRTRRRFLPNLHKVTFRSEALGQDIALNVATSTVRTVDHNGGFDQYLTSTSSRQLTEKAQKIKNKIAKALLSKSA